MKSQIDKQSSSLSLTQFGLKYMKLVFKCISISDNQETFVVFNLQLGHIFVIKQGKTTAEYVCKVRSLDKIDTG